MTPDLKKEKEEDIKANEDYERFGRFWEKARNIRDEDGDNILKWDKSIIAQFCFTRGYDQALLSQRQEFERMIDEMIYICPKNHIECKIRMDTLEKVKSKLMEMK